MEVGDDEPGQMHCTPIKIQVGDMRHYFGWTGGFSEKEHDIEIGYSLAVLLGLEDGMLVSA